MNLSSGDLSPIQQCLPGFESYFAPLTPAWRPLPQTLDRVKAYFLGYVAFGKKIFARRKHVAAELGMKVRTLSRYIAYLVESGWMKTVKRTPRHAVRQVLANFGTGTSDGTCIEVTSEIRGVVYIQGEQPPPPVSKQELNEPTPLPERVQEALRAGAARIAAARNPVAYRHSIIQGELRAMKSGIIGKFKKFFKPKRTPADWTKYFESLAEDETQC